MSEPEDQFKWKQLANCRDMDPDLFFPRRGDVEAVRAAKAVCAGCVVRAQCLEAGMKERGGIWGGETERQRRARKREKRNAS